MKKQWLPTLPSSRTSGSGPRIRLSIPFSPYRCFADRGFLEAEYVAKQKSAQRIARECGCSHSTILKYLREFGIKIRKNFDQYQKGQVPYGWRLSGGELQVNEAEEAAIENMASLRSKGFSYHRIAAALNKLGILTKHGTSRWHAATVMKILRVRLVQ